MDRNSHAEHDRRAVRRAHRRRALHEPDDHRRIERLRARDATWRATWSRSYGMSRRARPDGLRAENDGEIFLGPLDHHAHERLGSHDAEGRRPRSARSSTRNTRSRASCSRTTATRSKRWRRRCSSWKRSTPIRSTTSWPASRREPPKPTSAPASELSRRARRRHPSPRRRRRPLEPEIDDDEGACSNVRTCCSPAGGYHCRAARRARMALDLTRPCVMGIRQRHARFVLRRRTVRRLRAARSPTRDELTARQRRHLSTSAASRRDPAPPVPTADGNRARHSPSSKRWRARTSIVVGRHAQAGRHARGGEQARLMINDVGALRARRCGRRCRGDRRLGMPDAHAGRAAQRMQIAPHYDDVVAEVRDFLARSCRARARRRASRGSGSSWTRALASARRSRIICSCCGNCGPSPALGYRNRGGAVAQSRAGRAHRTASRRRPASLRAWPRRLPPTARGASIVRVHDARATVDALQGLAAPSRGVQADAGSIDGCPHRIEVSDERRNP